MDEFLILKIIKNNFVHSKFLKYKKIFHSNYNLILLYIFMFFKN